MLEAPVETVTPQVEPDGRRRRGETSRREILDAATSQIVRAGVGSLTHRAVAEAAGVPLARVSYHFPKVDDLLVAAASQYLEAFDSQLRQSADRSRSGTASIVETCTDLLHDLVTTGAPEFLAMVEVRLALARRNQPVPDTEIVTVIRSFGADEVRAKAVVAAMFGFAVLAAAEPSPVERSVVRAYTQKVLEGMS